MWKLLSSGEGGRGKAAIVIGKDNFGSWEVRKVQKLANEKISQMKWEFSFSQCQTAVILLLLVEKITVKITELVKVFVTNKQAHVGTWGADVTRTIWYWVLGVNLLEIENVLLELEEIYHC